MSREGRLIQEIRAAVEAGRLKEPFAPKDLIQAGIRCAASTPGTFLPKHRVGNPGGYTELFVRVQVAPSRYKLA